MSAAPLPRVPPQLSARNASIYIGARIVDIRRLKKEKQNLALRHTNHKKDLPYASPPSVLLPIQKVPG